MRFGALPILALACVSVGCSGQPGVQNPVLEAARTVCEGAAIPLPEGVMPPVLISNVKPSPGPHAPYPSAKSCLEVQVEVDGSVTFVRTVSTTSAAFADIFRQAVVRWRYQPAELNGKPVPVRLAVSATFEHH